MVDKFVKVFCVIFLWSHFGVDVVPFFFVLQHCDIMICFMLVCLPEWVELIFLPQPFSPLHMMWCCALISLSYQGWVLLLVDITFLSGAICSRACSTVMLNESIAHDSDYNSSILFGVWNALRIPPLLWKQLVLFWFWLALFFGLFMLTSMYSSQWSDMNFATLHCITLINLIDSMINRSIMWFELCVNSLTCCFNPIASIVIP